jgi:hypothetical protein
MVLMKCLVKDQAEELVNDLVRLLVIYLVKHQAPPLWEIRVKMYLNNQVFEYLNDHLTGHSNGWVGRYLNDWV